ncbi:MAG TPA: hypothetical protein VGJ00_08635 [Rhabdochlamydiaceae bacterium]|jgi:hypothetical protein
MRTIFSILFFLLAGLAQANTLPLLNWREEEAAIKEKAQEQNQPILLAFIKADCPWSALLREVLENLDFSQVLEQRALVCFYTLHAEGEAEETALREKFAIEQCPTLLLLDPKAREFARLGYLSLEAAAYAECVSDLVADFRTICRVLTKEEGKPKNWLELYHKAQQLSCKEFKKIILDRGIRENPDIALLLEKYQALLEEHSLKSRSVRECRHQLIQRDPHNRLGVHFKLAMADFHKRVALKGRKSPEKILQPLMQYLKRYEKKDKDNAWRAEMEIAHYLAGLDRYGNALEFARRAQAHAPQDMREGIAASIEYMQSRL